MNDTISKGYETVSSTMYAISIVLGMYPLCQEKLYNEICQIVPDESIGIRAEDLSKLSYLDQFVKETMRLLPTIPLITRHVSKELKIGKRIVIYANQYKRNSINHVYRQSYHTGWLRNCT